MKSEKGITLTSVMIYIIGMIIVIALISNITSYFYRNVEIGDQTQDVLFQMNQLNTYFTEDTNRKGNQVIQIGYLNTDGTTSSETNYAQHYIAFSQGNQYTFVKQQVENLGTENEKVTYGAIYLNRVKIVSNVADCRFREVNQNGKPLVEVTIRGENGKERTSTYVLEQ